MWEKLTFYFSNVRKYIKLTFLITIIIIIFNLVSYLIFEILELITFYLLIILLIEELTTVPGSFHRTNPINAFRGIFGLKRATI